MRYVGGTAQKAVLEALRSGCGHGSYRALASRTGLGVASVYDAVQRLHADGIITPCQGCDRGWVPLDAGPSGSVG